MDVVIIYNGLGNQMSQYAFYLQKKNIDKTTRFITLCDTHNGLELDKVFNISCRETIAQKFLYVMFRLLRFQKAKIITSPVKFILGLFNCRVVEENFNYSFNKNNLLPSKGITFYLGGWHSEKYFLAVKEQIFATFKFNEPADPENMAHIKNIKSQNSVSIHVRRGDYLDTGNYNLFGGVCTENYYQAAIDLIETKVNNPRFFVFSNDTPWVKANLHISNVVYVTGNAGNNSWKDLYLMTLCKHHIIANSSFSWWGAWLNNNPGKIVITPGRFLMNDENTDVYPESWTKLSDY